jgi:Lsr2
MAKIYIPAAGECEILDDLDFMSPARTVRFSLDGVHYELALSATNLEKLRSLLKPYIAVSHIIGRDAMPKT